MTGAKLPILERLSDENLKVNLVGSLPYRLRRGLIPVASQLVDRLPSSCKESHLLKLATILAFAIGLFLVDLWFSRGAGGGVLYVAPVAWIALWSSRHESSLVLLVATASTVLAILGFLLTPQDTFWLGLANRGVAISVMWMTAVLSLLRKRVEEEVKTLRGLLPICSYCKRIRDDQGYWKQIEVYIAANSHADFSHGMCPECVIQHYPDIFKEGVHKEQPTGTGA